MAKKTIFEFTISNKSYRAEGVSVEAAFQELMENKAFSLSTLGDISGNGIGEYEIKLPTIKVKKLLTYSEE